MDALRQRLFNPPNAVPDRPLELRNGKPVCLVPPTLPPAPEASPIAFLWPGELAADCWLSVPPSALHSPTVLDRREIIAMAPVERRIAVRDIIAAVAAEWCIDVVDILSPRHFRRCVIPRHVVMTLARHLTSMSFPRIARAVGRKDHSTVLHAVRKYVGAYEAAAAEVGRHASLPALVVAMRRQVEAGKCGGQ